MAKYENTQALYYINPHRLIILINTPELFTGIFATVSVATLMFKSPQHCDLLEHVECSEARIHRAVGGRGSWAFCSALEASKAI